LLTNINISISQAILFIKFIASPKACYYYIYLIGRLLENSPYLYNNAKRKISVKHLSKYFKMVHKIKAPENSGAFGYSTHNNSEDQITP